MVNYDDELKMNNDEFESLISNIKSNCKKSNNSTENDVILKKEEDFINSILKSNSDINLNNLGDNDIDILINNFIKFFIKLFIKEDL